jgi:hypothetical protein
MLRFIRTGFIYPMMMSWEGVPKFLLIFSVLLFYQAPSLVEDSN